MNRESRFNVEDRRSSRRRREPEIHALQFYFYYFVLLVFFWKHLRACVAGVTSKYINARYFRGAFVITSVSRLLYFSFRNFFFIVFFFVIHIYFSCRFINSLAAIYQPRRRYYIPLTCCTTNARRRVAYCQWLERTEETSPATLFIFPLFSTRIAREFRPAPWR